MEKDIVFGDIPMRIEYTQQDEVTLVQSIHLLHEGSPCGADIAPMLNVSLMAVPGFPPVPMLNVLFQEVSKCQMRLN